MIKNKNNDMELKNSTVTRKDGKLSEKGDVKKVSFPDFENENEVKGANPLSMLNDVPLKIVVELGKTVLKIEEILKLGIGSIIELDKVSGEPVDIMVNGKPIAKGEVVVIDEDFGVRITDVVLGKKSGEANEKITG